MSPNKGRLTAQFGAPRGTPSAHHRDVDKLPFPCPKSVPAATGPAGDVRARPRRPLGLGRTALGRHAWLCALAGLAGLAAGPALAAGALGTAGAADAAALPAELAAQVQRLAAGAAAVVWGSAAKAPRIEVEVGRLDPRLRLAPCQQIVPYLPAGARPLGRTRVGLRCAQGERAWNVSLPVVVRLWAPSLAAATALPAGTVLEARHLITAEVDLAERADPAIGEPAALLGRTLARGLAAGDALRRGDLKSRQYFAAGDTVRIVAVGPGYAVSSEGQALGPGLEGQTAKVRTESGRVVSGLATGERRIEVTL